MFCPDGYQTVQKIMEDALANPELKERSAELMLSMLRDDSLHSHAVWLVERHPLPDIIEKIVFEEAHKVGLYICSPSGVVMSLNMPFHYIDYNIHRLLFHAEEYAPIEQFDDFFDQTEDLEILKSHLEQLKYVAKDSADKERYNSWMVRIWSQSRCAVNLYHNRNSYTVDTGIFDALLNTHLMHWSPVGLGVGDEGPVLRRLAGYSLCVREKHKSSFSPAAINQKFGEVMYSKMVGEDVPTPERTDTDNTNGSKGGRPNKSDHAAKLVLEHFGRRYDWTLKEAVRFLEAEHDVRVAKRTLQRGMKRLSEDKT